MTGKAKRTRTAHASGFAARLLRWHRRHGRHDLPWQHPRSAYRVWVAEIMLQQTQVATVIPYYRRFLKRFPTLRALASATPDAVLAQWSGLGYYARARNLHRAARQVVRAHRGRFPREFAAVAALPGIGRSTAGAILAQAFGQRHPILDGNARRVLARHAAVPGWPGVPAVQERLWREAGARLPRARLADYTQALMDLGATVCTARVPACGQCPVRADCRARLAQDVGRYPARRPTRPRPVRRADLLLIENASGAILFERRPAQGLWGGLWCPPLAQGDWRAACHRLGLRPRRAAALPPLRHGFTHFELELRPLRVPNGDSAPRVPRHRWITPAQARRRGLPAPVRTLIDRLE